jgi:hypothetical protein
LNALELGYASWKAASLSHSAQHELAAALVAVMLIRNTVNINGPEHFVVDQYAIMFQYSSCMCRKETFERIESLSDEALMVSQGGYRFGVASEYGP